MLASLPFIFFYRVIYTLNRYWAHSVMWLLKVVVGCNYRVEGLENLPKQGGFVIASKHQSAWETILPFALFPKAVFVYKKELGYIPIYGWYNIAFRNIKVNRTGGASALKKVLAQAVQRVGQGHQVIIFPQGSRTPFGQHREYRPAIYAMYREGLPVYPAALNADGCWPKSGLKKPGTIVWKFLPQIEPGLSRDEFMSRLEQLIESESAALR